MISGPRRVPCNWLKKRELQGYLRMNKPQKVSQMQLLSSPASPFARKVRVLLHEADMRDAVEICDVTALAVGDTDPGLVAANPLGKLPTLIRPEGPALYDSRVILRFLNDIYDLGLYPEGRLWEVLTLEATADAMMDAAILIIYEARFRPESLQSAEWMAGQWSKVDRALEVLESRWLGHLAGHLDMAQIGVGCALGYLDFRHGDRGWRDGRPGLAAWYEEFAARPSMMATQPQG